MLWPGSMVAEGGEMFAEGLAASTVNAEEDDGYDPPVPRTLISDGDRDCVTSRTSVNGAGR